MKAKEGTKILFRYDGKDYALEIQSITIYKNYSWIGCLGYANNFAFCVHGDLDCCGEPVLEGLAVQYDDMNNIFIHGYIRKDVNYKL